MRRKTLAYMISMILGVTVWMHKSTVVFMCIGIFCVLYYIFFKHTSKEKRMVCIMAFFFCIGVVRIAISDYQFSKSQLEQPIKASSTCTLYKIEEKGENEFKLYCDNLRLNGYLYPGKLIISYYSDISEYPTLIGDTIEFYGEIDNPKEAGNPRCFDYKKYLKSQNIYYCATISSFDIIESDKSVINRIKSFIFFKREDFLKKLKCNDEIKGFIKGVIFGDKSQLDDDMYNDFRNNGTAHILAVSGLHVGILFGIYKSLSKKRKSKYIVYIFFIMLLFYGTLTLWSISVTRAIILVVLLSVGDLLNRRYDLTTAVAVVAGIVVISNPYIILNNGFQMSFLAVVSISFIGTALGRYMNKTLATMVSIQVGMMPYTAYVFNYVPLIGFIANIPIIFITSILVPIGLLTFLIYFILGICPLPFVLESIAKMLVEINHLIANNGLFAIDVASPKLWIIVGFYLVIFYLCSEGIRVEIHRKNKKKIYKMFSLILIVIILSAHVGKSEFDNAFAIFVDVGQGDCIHLRCNNGVNVLIDGGGNLNYNVGEKILKPYLLKNNVRNLELAAATHLHTDHYLGIQQLNSCYNIKNVLTKGKLGQRIKLDDSCYIDIIWPAKQEPNIDDENLNSLIFKINYEGTTVLVTGDITAEGEKNLLDYYQGKDTLKCDILKIAHHGSKYSSCDEFIDACNPELAVISVGKNNYGHPSNEVIEKLDKKGIMIFRTDTDGAIGIIDNKGKIEVCTKKQK